MANSKPKDPSTDSPGADSSDEWTKFDDLFRSAGRINNVDPTWLKAIALNESDLGREASVARGLEDPTDVDGSTSSDGKSWGLMQVTIPTGQQFDPNVTPEKLNNASYSVNLSARLVSWLKDQFSDSDPRFLQWVIKSYNQGRGNTNKERKGQIEGYAQAYWDRFQRNLKTVQDKGGL